MADEHKGDLDRVSQQNSTTDIVRGVEDGSFPLPFVEPLRPVVAATPLGRVVASRTDFDKRDLDLNEMIDLVEQTDPEDLETSGKALWDARDAIKKAADDLKAHMEKVHWVGESGNAFRGWGDSLVTNTHHLSAFAGAAGDQITAAAVGLASVRGGMPARDPANRKRPKDFTDAEKAANKADYDDAVKVEQHRQEAINQMNRLASYYAVSEEMLASLPAKDQTPDFTSMPEVGVPRPKYGGSYGVDRPESAAGSHGGTASASAVGRHTTVTPDVVRHAQGETATPPHVPTTDTTHKVPTIPDDHVGTNIDSTGTLPPPTTTHTTGPTPPVTGTPPTNSTPPDVLNGGGYRIPMPKTTTGRGPVGTGGYRTPPFAQGRTGTTGPTSPSAGRPVGQGPMNQMGRTTPTGQPGARNTTPPSPMGRAVTGGTQRAGGPVPRANSGPTTGAGRSNGVVGGRPTPTGGSAKNGARIPRGTVIGGEAAANSRPATGRVGQRGVVGAPESTVRPGSKAAGSRAGTGTPETVTGKPTGRNSAAGAERNGMTRGGAGLVRGASRNGKPEGEEQQGSQRPDYLVEDEEAHLPDKPRRDVPPVVN